MNPVDHPHGGGQGKTKGGRPSVTPFSRITKGKPTRNKRKQNALILSRRK
jgi:large subunit ribosomal protein L2